MKNKNLLVYLPVLFLFLIGIGTKGGLLIILLSFLVSSLLFFKRNVFKNLFYIFSSFILYLLVRDILVNQFISDIENYTSVATRSTLFIFGLSSLFYSPIGMGFSGYYPYFYNNIDNAVMIVREILPFNLNFDELKTYSQVGNFESIGTKSFFLDCIITYGFPFVILSYFYIKDIILFSIKNGDFYRIFFLIFILLSLLLYNSSFGMYIGAFSLGLLFNKHFKNRR